MKIEGKKVGNNREYGMNKELVFAGFKKKLYLRTLPIRNNSYLAMLERIFQYSPVATPTPCSPYSSSLAIICKKNGLHLIMVLK